MGSLGYANHRQIEALLLGAIDSNLIAGIGVAHHPGARIVTQHAAETSTGFWRTVGHYDHTGMLRVAHADAAPVVQRYPGRAACGIQQSVEPRPVGYRIGAVVD